MEIRTEMLSNNKGAAVNLLTKQLTQALPIQKFIRGPSSNRDPLLLLNAPQAQKSFILSSSKKECVSRIWHHTRGRQCRPRCLRCASGGPGACRGPVAGVGHMALGLWADLLAAPLALKYWLHSSFLP